MAGTYALCSSASVLSGSSRPAPGWRGGIASTRTSKRRESRLVYRDEEDAAKAARRGLWKDPKAIPPWAWRKGREGEVLVVGREAANSRCITTLPGALVQRRYGACRSSADDLPRQRTPPTCPAREGSWP